MANPQKENGSLMLANELVEALARTQLSPNESQILWAVLRKTYCWHKKADWIAFKQFRELTGMLDPHISKVLKRLIEKKILTRSGKSYGVNKDYEQWQKLPKQVTHLPKQVTRLTDLRKKKLPTVVDTKESKETITKESAIALSDKSQDKRNPNLQELLDYASQGGFPFQGSVASNRRAAWNLLRGKGMDLLKAKQLVAAAIKTVKIGDQYAPRVNDFESLYRRKADLIIYWKNKQEKGRHLEL